MDRLGQLTLDKLSLDKMKNMVGEVRDTIAPRNDTEKRVYEALSNKNWGASSTLLNDIARDTYDFEKYGIILPLIWNVLQSPSREWRKVFKSLSLLEHLVKNGAERVIEDARDNLHRVRMLSDFNYYEGPVDKGSGVREKSKQLIDLLKDNELIREEREKARKLRDKYVGLGSGGGFSGGGYGGSYSSGGGGYGGDRYGNGPSRYGDSSYSSGGGGYSDRGGGSYSDRGGGGYSDRRGGGYSDSADRDDFRGGYGYSDARDGDKDKSKDKPKDTEKEQEPSSSSSSSSKPKRDRKKSSGPKLAIKIKDKDKDKVKNSSAETPAAPVPVPDLLGGDLLTTEATPVPASIPVPATTGGQLGDLFSAPVAAAPAGAGSSNVGLDSFDPRAGSSTGTAAATTTGGFGHNFVGFTPAPAPVTTPVPAFPVTGVATAFDATADPFASTPTPVLSGGSSFPGGVMNRTNSANNGAEEFSDFQSSGPTLTATASSGETGSRGGMTNGGAASTPGGITNPKWRDVSSLVDLGGLSSNTDKKAAQQKQEEQTFQSNNNSFAGLDGFQTKPQGMGTARPTAGPTGLSGGMHGVGMMGGGMGFQQQHAMRGGLMGAQQGMVFPQQQQQQQAFGTQGMGMGMGMGMGGMPGQQMGAGMSMGMGMGMQQGGGTMGSKRGMQAGGAAGAGGAVMPGGFTGTGASGSFY